MTLPALRTRSGGVVLEGNFRNSFRVAQTPQIVRQSIQASSPGVIVLFRHCERIPLPRSQTTRRSDSMSPARNVITMVVFTAKATTMTSTTSGRRFDLLLDSTISFVAIRAAIRHQ